MFEKNLLEKEVILVTGGGSGLGKSMAKRFAELGAKIIISSRRLEVLENTAKEIQSTIPNSEIFPLTCDVRNFDQVEKVVQEGVKKFGKITGLVNNAAGNFLAETENLSPNAFKAIVDIVLYGSFHATLACGRQMMKQENGGRILNIVTTYAKTGSAFVVPSACGKAGVLNMTKSLGAEWADRNIRVNAIAPGPFPTEEAWKRLLPKGMEEMAKQRIPLKRFGEHIELANLASYLMSPYSAYMTGECVTIDGGESLMGGEFNHFLATTNLEQRKQMFELMKPKKTAKGNNS